MELPEGHLRLTESASVRSYQEYSLSNAPDVLVAVHIDRAQAETICNNCFISEFVLPCAESAPDWVILSKTLKVFLWEMARMGFITVETLKELKEENERYYKGRQVENNESAF